MRHAVVIGAGFGGLALANRLQSAGFQVTVFEKREQVGGRAYRLTDSGYTFDMGPSLVTAPSIIDNVFREAGRSLQDYVDLVPLDPFYRIHFHDGTCIDYNGDADHMKRQMAVFSPRDAGRYDAFMAAAKPIYEAVIEDELGARPFDTFSKLASFAPKAIRLGALRRVANFAGAYFEDFRHHFLFSFHPLFIGGNPFRVPSVYIMIPYLEKREGVWFSKGGMYSIVQALEKLLHEQGGAIHVGSPVQRIAVKDGVATGVYVDDALIEADLVISNADTAYTYATLVDSGQRKRWSDRRIEGLHQSMSCFLLYLGVRRQYPRLAHHTLILSERYEELIRDIFDRKILADDFSMYVHAPTRTDSTMAPEGCESMYVLVPVPNLEADVDWDETAGMMKDRVIDFLEHWGLDDLRANTEVLRVFTPADFESELNAWNGNAFGSEPRLTQTATFRPHNRSEDVRNLYLVGAGTHPGAGVPGVLLSAEATAAAIRQDFPDVGLPLRLNTAEEVAS